jgi:predicted amidohydrolase YtcJ
MQLSQPAGAVSVPGFTDHHAHLLRQCALQGRSAGTGSPLAATSGVAPPPKAVADFHRRVAALGRSPMDVLDPAPDLQRPDLDERLLSGLSAAAAAGLVEITEMGMRSWAYADSLAALQAAGPLPCRVRIYLASGLAEESSLTELEARRAACGPWLQLDGVKFYADGWLVPRTCAVCRDFADAAGRGVLFTSAEELARRIQPLAGRGWRIATHAIGDRAVQVVLDAYALAFDGDAAAIARAAPRIEHASVLSADLISRMADCGVVACLQPSFALTDASQLLPALGPQRASLAYPWTQLAAAGVPMLAGTDYPIEILEPLPSLARLVAGRSDRPGFGTAGSAPEQARLPAATAFALMSDASAGQTLLTADPRAVPASQLDLIEVVGTAPAPLSAPR